MQPNTIGEPAKTNKGLRTLDHRRLWAAIVIWLQRMTIRMKIVRQHHQPPPLVIKSRRYIACSVTLFTLAV